MVNDTPISATGEEIEDINSDTQDNETTEDIKWTFRRTRKPKKI